ncbi:hypothetical protein GCM10022251_41550 [Phytohabitans flavus]
MDLGQGLGLMPMTPALFDELRRGDEVDPQFTPARLFPPRFEVMLAAWSVVDPVAYVEAEYFGVIGSQFAAVWQGGTLVLGPLVLTEDEPWPAPGWSPISQSLRHLGVSADGHYDEFDAIGLGRHRHVEDWLPTRPQP